VEGCTPKRDKQIDRPELQASAMALAGIICVDPGDPAGVVDAVEGTTKRLGPGGAWEGRRWFYP
jgi:hypothetical protein